jgi:hypothetical protein
MASKALEFVTDSLNQISPVPLQPRQVATAIGVTAATYVASKVLLAPSARVLADAPFDSDHQDTKSVYDLRARRHGTAYATTVRHVEAKVHTL